MPRVTFITDSFPFGPAESFFAPELRELQARGLRIEIVPLRPYRRDVHRHAEEFAGSSVRTRLLSARVLLGAVRMLARRPLRTSIAAAAMLRDLRPSVLARNLAVLPKGLFIADRLLTLGADHVHALWAAAAASAGLVAHLASGVPFSFTAHRYDIEQDNLLALKCARARFVRAISGLGLAAIVQRAPAARGRILILRMGVDARAAPAPLRGGRPRLLCAASLIPLKRHADLLRAFAIARRSVDLGLAVAGGGPLEAVLKDLARRLGIAEDVEFLGDVAHEELIARLRSGEFRAGILTSEIEGISVAAMETMAAGVPMIATDAGAMRDLVDGDCGALVPIGDTVAIAGAIERFATDPAGAAAAGRAAQARVAAEFNARIVAQRLDEAFAAEPAGGSP